jgi:hypothetical protein
MQFDGEGQDAGGVLFGGDLDDGLKEPKLQPGRVFRCSAVPRPT